MTATRRSTATVLFARPCAAISHRLSPELIEQRGELLAGPHGRVLELGAGDGINHSLYRPQVTEVVAAEAEPCLRETESDSMGRLGVCRGFCREHAADDSSLARAS